MSERRPAPPPRITALPYGPQRQLGRVIAKLHRTHGMQYETPAPAVVASWTDEDGYRLGQWHDGRVFRYMETVW